MLCTMIEESCIPTRIVIAITITPITAIQIMKNIMVVIVIQFWDIPLPRVKIIMIANTFINIIPMITIIMNRLLELIVIQF